MRCRVNELRATLDPVRLLQQIRAAQQQLVDIADQPALGEAAKPNSTAAVMLPVSARARKNSSCRALVNLSLFI
jgi:hypothetical protein